LKLVEVWRRDNRRLNTIEEKALKNFGNSIEVGDRVVVKEETGLFEERRDGGGFEKSGKLNVIER